MIGAPRPRPRTLSRRQYDAARAVCRQEGRTGLLRLSHAETVALDAVLYQRPRDPLAERVERFTREGRSIEVAKSIARRLAAGRRFEAVDPARRLRGGIAGPAACSDDDRRRAQDDAAERIWDGLEDSIAQAEAFWESLP